MYSSLHLLLWQSVLAYEAGRLMVCWDGSKISKNIQPTTVAALPWPGGAMEKEIFQVKSRISEAFFILLLLRIRSDYCRCGSTKRFCLILQSAKDFPSNGNWCALLSLDLLAPLFPHNRLHLRTFLVGNFPAFLLWLLQSRC